MKKIVTVQLEGHVATNIMQLIGIRSIPVQVTARAAADVQEGPLCILALDPTAEPGIGFSGSAELDAKKCVVRSNAGTRRSIEAKGASKAAAKKFCAVGEFQRGGASSVTPRPEERCSPIPDPLAGWKPPTAGPCRPAVNEKSKGTVELEPGTYCGGITVTADHIVLRPGIYIVKDGPLHFDGNRRIEGDGVGIYLTGHNATVNIGGTAEIDIAAPSIGPMAGMAIAQDPASAADQTSSVTGNAELRIKGALYFPTQVLRFWGNAKPAVATPQTAIVAKRIEIGGNALLRVHNDRDFDGALSQIANAIVSGVRLIQ